MADRHSGARAQLASPEPMHTGLSKLGSGWCSWFPGLPLQGIPE
jgi:hypothetical protein